MASKVSRRWRPRSLPQLVLLAFAVVMLPIAVLIYQAGQAMSELSELADISARQAVDQTRRARMLANLSRDMERSARQYAIVEDPGLMTIFTQKADRYGELLSEHARLLNNGRLINALRQELDGLKTLPQAPIDEFRSRLPEFASFSDDTDTLLQDTSALIDARIDSIQARARSVRTRLWLLTTALVSASLLLILYFTWLIIRPIRQLERRILSIGSGVEADEASVRINGPAELVNLDKRLSWLSSRLRELEAQKQQFLRHMSHELKTPLASIREGAGLLADGVVGELTKRQREIVLLLDDSSQELQTLIEQLLDYNLLQQNRRLVLSKFDVITVVQEVISKHRLALEQKGMQAHWLRKPVYWHADRVRTARILDNLVSNAVAYGEDGGKLWIRAQVEDNQLVLEVANTGTPIAEHDRPHLFEPFYQGGARRKGPLKGSGIGLSVAADSARAQQGTLALVDDESGEATVCFRLTLPWVTDGENADTERDAAAA